MRKQMIPIYLEERQGRIVRQIAKEEGVSISHLVRKSLDEFIRKLPAEKDPARQIVGLGSSGISDLATRHDEYLIKEIASESKKQ